MERQKEKRKKEERKKERKKERNKKKKVQRNNKNVSCSETESILNIFREIIESEIGVFTFKLDTMCQL